MTKYELRKEIDQISESLYDLHKMPIKMTLENEEIVYFIKNNRINQYSFKYDNLTICYESNYRLYIAMLSINDLKFILDNLLKIKLGDS